MFGSSGGIVVVSSCLDGPRVHRPADSAWMEARVDSHQVTGAGTTKLAATDVPGGARPGRITVRAALSRGAHTLVRKSSTRRAVRLLQSKDRRGRPNRTRTRWTLWQSCSKGEGRLKRPKELLVGTQSLQIDRQRSRLPTQNPISYILYRGIARVPEVICSARIHRACRR